MRSFIFIAGMLLGSVLQAQNTDPVFAGSSAKIIEWRKAMNAGKTGEALALCRTVSAKQLFSESFKTVSEQYGSCLDAVLTDSTFETQKTDPKAFVTLNYISYYENALLQEKFVLVKDKKELKIASYVYTAGYGNYNDPFMNFGIERAAGMFVELLSQDRTHDAYNLFAPAYGSVMTPEKFAEVIAVVKDFTGEFLSLDLVDECSALLYRKMDESVAYGLFRVNGSKDTVFLETNVSYSDRAFYLYGFDFFSEYELNNKSDIRQAENIAGTVLHAHKNGQVAQAYALLNNDLKATKSEEEFGTFLAQLDEALGNIKSSKTVDKFFCRSGQSLADNEYVLVVETEGEKSTFISLFLFGYDSEMQLKVNYFYLNQF